MLTDFAMIQGQITEIGALRKMLIASEQNKLGMLAFRRSKENNFLYRMVRSKVKIQWRILSEYRLQNVKQKFT